MKPGDRATLFLSPMDRHPVRIERLVDDTKAEVRFSNGATLVCPISMLRARSGVG
jgi:hypothetical protein